MANSFKNSITGSVGTSGVIAYRTPSATTTTVIGVSVANAAAQNISVSALVGGEQKLVLGANDFISVTSSLANSADVVVSVLEVS